MLLGYVDRQLDAGTMAALDRHVPVCPDCSRVVEAQRAVWSALEAWEPIAAAADFDDHVMARVRAEADGAPSSWWQRFAAAMTASWKPAVPLAAACAVLVGVSVWRGGSGGVAIESAITLDTAEATQVEEALSDVQMLRDLGVASASAEKL
jgi:hypothetical protein